MTFGSQSAPTGPTRGHDSWTLGVFFGIPLRVRRSFMIVVGVVAFMGAMGGCQANTNPTTDLLAAIEGAGASLVFLLSLFLAVVLHEFGHALMAQKHNIEVVEIAVWPLGGVAMMRDMPEDSAIEARVSLAGPLVNLAMAMIFSALGAIFVGEAGIGLDSGELTVAGMLAFGVMINLALGLFNLIPAFPMDGGKVLRAFLARKGDWMGATQTAVKVGRMCSWGMVLAAFVYGEPVLAVIGFYLLFAGAREMIFLRMRHGGGGGFGGFSGGNLAEMLQRMQAQSQGKEQGFEPSPEQDSGMDPDGPIVDVERKGSSSGFSDDDMRRLESDHSPLRRPDQPE
jgi:Zn-dependent protease